MRNLIEKCKKNGIPIGEVKRKLIEGGMDGNLIDRFIREVLEEMK